MAFWRRQKTQDRDPAELVAEGRYDAAVEIYRGRLEEDDSNLFLRQKLAEALALSGHSVEAVAEYSRVAEEHARQGFTLRAVAVYRRILDLDPGQSAIAGRILHLQSVHAESAGTSDRQKLTLFADLEPEELASIVGQLREHACVPEQIIVREGAVGSSMWLITTGKVAVRTRDHDGQEFELAELGPGDFFGEVSLLVDKPRTATVVAKTEVELLELTRSDVQQITAQHPRVRQVLIDFHERRAEHAVETLLVRMRNPSTDSHD